MNLEELKTLDFEDPGGWPILAKAIASVVVVIAIVAVGYFLSISDKRVELESRENREQQLFSEFEQKHYRAARLEEFEEQLVQMEEILRSLLRQLPSKTEMDSLLRDVSQTAVATGIDIKRFRPEGEILKDFYAEQPISLRMVGTYHEFGEFVSAVASLARVVILTMHDISLTPQGDTGELVLEGTVKTYRYLDEEEEAAASGGGQ